MIENVSGCFFSEHSVVVDRRLTYIVVAESSYPIAWGRDLLKSLTHMHTDCKLLVFNTLPT